MYREYLKKLNRGNQIFSTQISILKIEKKNEFDIEKDKLFFDFLKNNEQIEEFEPKLEEPILKINTFKKENAFYNAFEKMKQEITWKKYKFPKIIFIKLYQKSKKLRKKIINFSLINLKRASDVIESYNPKYNNENQHNWLKNPKESYNKYNQKIKKINQLDKEKDNSNYKDIGEKSDIVILTRNRNNTKDLIFSGKLCNIYIQNEYSSNENEKKSLSNKIRNGRKEYYFSFLNEPNYLNKKEIENKKEKENELPKFIYQERHLFNHKYYHHKDNDRKIFKLNTFKYESNLSSFDLKSNNKYNSRFSNLPSSKIKLTLNKNKKNIFYTPKNLSNFSTGKLETKPPILKHFLNKSDFYY